MIIVLLNCGHWVDGGHDIIYWLTMKANRHDVNCHACGRPGGTVRHVLQPQGDHMYAEIGYMLDRIGT